MQTPGVNEDSSTLRDVETVDCVVCLGFVSRVDDGAWCSYGGEEISPSLEAWGKASGVTGRQRMVSLTIMLM